MASSQRGVLRRLLMSDGVRQRRTRHLCNNLPDIFGSELSRQRIIEMSGAASFTGRGSTRTGEAMS